MGEHRFFGAIGARSDTCIVSTFDLGGSAGRAIGGAVYLTGSIVGALDGQTITTIRTGAVDLTSVSRSALDGRAACTATLPTAIYHAIPSRGAQDSVGVFAGIVKGAVKDTLAVDRSLPTGGAQENTFHVGNTAFAKPSRIAEFSRRGAVIVAHRRERT